MFFSRIGSLGTAMDNAGPEKQLSGLLFSFETADLRYFRGWC